MEIKYNRSLSGVPEAQQLRKAKQPFGDNPNPVRRNLTSLYNDVFKESDNLTQKYQFRNQVPIRKILNGDRVKKSLNLDLEDKENMPQIKVPKVLTLPQEAAIVIPKQYTSTRENKNLQRLYSIDIFFHLKNAEPKTTPNEALKNHAIPQNLRSKMVDWMVEVLCSYKCTEQTFFVAVRVLDLYFTKSSIPLEVADLHISGVTAMFIAAKYEEIHPMKLQVVHEKIAHRKLSVDAIKKKESEILQTIDFDLTGATIYEQYNLILTNACLEDKLQQKHYKYLHKLCLYLAKMICYDYEISSKYSYTLLAAALIFVGFKIVEQLETQFNADSQLREIATNSELDYESLIEVAAKVLNLAKNFEKAYPNLENLKKFNGFQLEEE